jgi:hypothetical protein
VVPWISSVTCGVGVFPAMRVAVVRVAKRGVVWSLMMIAVVDEARE